MLFLKGGFSVDNHNQRAFKIGGAVVSCASGQQKQIISFGSPSDGLFFRVRHVNSIACQITAFFKAWQLPLLLGFCGDGGGCHVDGLQQARANRGAGAGRQGADRRH
jgi:hypothetical protein